MEGGIIEQRLHQAAVKGDVDLLAQILRDDPLILRRVGRLMDTPLHVAASAGRLDFVRKILEENPALAGVLDLRRWSPLHLASAEGRHEIVKELIGVNPEMCTALDGDGRNPLHLAAMKGEIEVLRVLLEARPYGAHELLNATDSGGNTLLHLAVKNDKFPTVEYLLGIVKDALKTKGASKAENTVKAVNVVNGCGYTALDLLMETENVVPESTKLYFKKARALRAKDIAQREWLSKKREALMLVATLIATMAFQGGVNPPGGFWPDNSDTHRAGEAIMAYNYPDSYPFFLHANTIGFVTSVSTILLLITGWPYKKRIFMWIMVVIMWLTITSMAFTYAFSITVVTPKKERGSLSDTIVVGVIAWCSVMAVSLLVHTVRSLNWWLESKDIYVWLPIKNFLNFSSCRQGEGQPRRNTNSANANHV